MATTTKTKAPPTTKNAVTKTSAGGVPANLAKRMEQDAGKGVSTAAEDRIIPLIYILQANSPQVKPRDPKYINGAQAGDIWLRNSAKRELVKGDEGFEFQPCYFMKVWVEWLPNRGGFVATHQERPPEARLQDVTKDDGSVVKSWVMPSGNLVVETRQHFGFADGQPYVIPFSSSGHTVSRTWMDLMNQFQVPGTSKPAPSFARKYHITTVEKTNAKNQSWSVMKIVDLGWVSDEEYERGLATYESLSRGEKQAAAPDADDDDGVDTSQIEG